MQSPHKKKRRVTSRNFVFNFRADLLDMIFNYLITLQRERIKENS